MNQKSFLLTLIAVAVLSVSCQQKSWVDQSIDTAGYQLTMLADEIADSAKLPRSIRNGAIRLEDLYDWTSGFFPGSLWYMYEFTGDESFKSKAQQFTNLLYNLKDYRGTHDLGFMVYCSYGNGFRLTGDTSYVPVMVQTADNLISRFHPVSGTIRSWDFGKWQYPVIIDNMMNLELLFWASEHTGDPKYKEVAVRHADITMQQHYRSDFSSYHVIDYDTITGGVRSKGTFQGYADESAWARGQAWGLYGYIVCYRFTQDEKYLDFARNIASFIMKSVDTNDRIPYWDYNAPNIPDAPRDASAAAITASALFELSTFVEDGVSYFSYAETILKNLSGEAYLAKKGENKGFVLMHSVGHLPANSEIDTPLNYADYYYLEALKRYKELAIAAN
ncbi:MAG: glycoside hydrolase family 88 protein [Paludibacter sp.]|nr:glycoside hydrolase family 88 protein [Paludibacter sp.]